MKDTVLNLRGLAPELKRRVKIEAARAGITLLQFAAEAFARELDRRASLPKA